MKKRTIVIPLLAMVFSFSLRSPGGAIVEVVQANPIGPSPSNATLPRAFREEGAAISLKLSISKPRYRVGDRVEVTATLENVSPDRIYYVGREIYRPDKNTPFHYVELSLFDQYGKSTRLYGGAGDDDPTILIGPGGKRIFPASPGLVQLVGSEYVQLRPGQVYGFMEWYYPPSTKPGRYRLSATYRELEALQHSESELDGLAFPIWTETLRSNEIEYTVIR